MYLTQEEEKILAGDFGEGIQSALQLIIDIGDFFNAEKLIPIASAHISGVSYLTGKDGILKNLSHFVQKGAHVSVPSTLNPCGMDRVYWQDMNVDTSFADKQFQILTYYQQLGVSTTCSCTPYDHGILPLKGQHIAWAESSAICFVNTFFGARTNKEDALSVLAAAITGRTSYYGLHIDMNRKPNIAVTVDAELNELADYGVLGHIIGEATKKMKFPWGPIPVFTIKNIPRPHYIKSLGAALASFGTAIFHIKDITPEQELIDYSSVDEKITVTEMDMKETFEKLSPYFDKTKPEPTLAVIGCPNASLEEISEVAKEIHGKRLRPGKEFWIFANRAQRSLAEATGYAEILSAAGVKIFSDTCPEVFPYDKKKYPAILTNSTKAIHYIPAPDLNGLPTYLLKLKPCVEAFFQ